MHRLLVIGGASLDILHLEGGTVSSVGGAGLYTALAARRCGVGVSLFSPRPDPMPEELRLAAGYLEAWHGPAVPKERLPKFEISHRGGETHCLQASVGAEADLQEAMLPEDLSAFDLVQVTPLLDAAMQKSFIEACRRRGAAKIAAGTFPRVVKKQPQLVAEIIALSDYFFLNREEAAHLFGSPEAAATGLGQVLFVTLGEEGALVIQGEQASPVPAGPATPLDPTGAGDAFCGAVLAFMLENDHPTMAARKAMVLAAEVIGEVGPAALLREAPPPEAPLDPRVQVNRKQVGKAAGALAAMDEAVPFPFTGPGYPPEGHPMALAYFFAATLQQFSFWWLKDGAYERPLLARMGGRELKGSDYLWQAYSRQLDEDPTFLAPSGQATLSREAFREVFRADDGSCPMPALDLHLEQARRYGQEMVALGFSPHSIVQASMNASRPLRTFIDLLDRVGGYKEDPLRKKSSLLAQILSERPERFLTLASGERIAPVIDYHLMRSCLRVGLIDVLDEALREKLTGRRVLSAEEEWAVRYPAYLAMEELISLSGWSSSAVDQFFFGARRRCPEMTDPDCGACPLDPVCDHRKALFQPVLRTSFY